MIKIAILLIAAHYLLDFVLQGEFVALGKNHKKPLPGVPWYHCLFAHAFLHGAAVFLITNNWKIGLAELALHFIIDYAKSDGQYFFWKNSFTTDQVLHLYCKAVYIAILLV